MRRATSALAPKGAATARTAFLPPPIGGLNTRDPRSQVPPTEALSMSNWFPGLAGLQKRKGTTGHITGTLSACETLMVYTNNSGTETMFAAITTAIYNVTAAGALGAAVVSGLANSRWQHVNFTNSSATAYLCAFNGADSPRYWDGSAWTAITGASTPAITGLTTTTIISATIHQRRMWLVQVNSLKLWYLPVDSVGGAAAALDLGGVANRGGYIMAANTWAADDGVGLNDYLVAITSAGQLIAYRGTDPSSASTWELAGVWDIAQPVGRRALYQYKGDLLILTTGGVASFSRIIAGASGDSSMITDKIAPTYITHIDNADTVPDLCQLLYYPKADMLIMSIAGFSCFAMNTVTGAWTKWSFVSRCWALLNEEPYLARYQNNNVIVRFWSTNYDELNGSTTDIAGTFHQGYSDLGVSGRTKKISLVQFVFYGSETTSLDFGFQPNYRATIQSQGARSLAANDGFSPWYPVTANASAFGLYFSSTSHGEDLYNGAYLVYQPGGMVGATAAM